MASKIKAKDLAEHAKQSDENQAYVGEVRISWVGS